MRSGDQCRQRWRNIYHDSKKGKKWTKEEEEILFKSQLIKGNKWKYLCDVIPGRTEHDIKNHFYSKLRGYVCKILHELETEKFFFLNNINKRIYHCKFMIKLIRKKMIPLINLKKENLKNIIIEDYKEERKISKKEKEKMKLIINEKNENENEGDNMGKEYSSMSSSNSSDLILVNNNNNEYLYSPELRFFSDNNKIIKNDNDINFSSYTHPFKFQDNQGQNIQNLLGVKTNRDYFNSFISKFDSISQTLQAKNGNFSAFQNTLTIKPIFPLARNDYQCFSY